MGQEPAKAEKREYLYLLRPSRPGMVSDGPTDAERAVIGDHFAYLTDLTRKGRVVLFGRTQGTAEDTFGIVVFEAGSDEEAAAVMGADPAVKAGMMTARLYPYRVAGMRAGGAG